MRPTYTTLRSSCGRGFLELLNTHYSTTQHNQLTCQQTFTHYGFKFLDPHLVLSPEPPGLSAAVGMRGISHSVKRDTKRKTDAYILFAFYQTSTWKTPTLTDL